EHMIEEMCCTQLVKDSESTEQDFVGRFGEDPAHVKAAVKQALASMPDGLEKDFFASIMPVEVLEHAGMKREDIRTHRKRGHEHLQEQVAAAVIHIAALEEDMLKQQGLSSKEIETIKKLSDRIIQGDMKS